MNKKIITTPQNAQKHINRILNKLAQQIPRAVGMASARAMNTSMKENYPVVTGASRRTLRSQTQKLGNNPSFSKNRVILHIGKNRGEGALLLQQDFKTKTYSLAQFGYPRFIRFKDEPHLLEWANARLSSSVREGWMQRGGMMVGRPETTHFGTKPWFTWSERATKRRLQNYVRRRVNRIRL